ncbi:MAG: hypothetical protein ACP5O1_09645 [Phycisphaerae bacterium]
MALLVQCHQCGKVLELDDGFRGGVCRCSQCGALLRVPMTDAREVQKSRPAEPAGPGNKRISSSGSGGDGSAAPNASSQSGRPETPDIPSSHRPGRPESPGAFSGSGSLRPARPESPLTERLAQRPAPPPDIGISSGIRRAQSPTSRRPPTKAQPGNFSRDITQPAGSGLRKLANLPIWVYAVSAAVVLLIVVALLIWALFAITHSSSSSAARNAPPRTAPVSTVEFLGIPIKSGKVIFSLDGSSANGGSFNLLVSILSTTINQLSSASHVRIAVWTTSGLKLYPTEGWLTASNKKKVFHSLLNYSPYGSTSITKMMIRTLKLGAQQNIFTTQKIIVPADLVTAVRPAIHRRQKIDVISIDGETHLLKKLADSTGGTFKMVSPSSLQ